MDKEQEVRAASGRITSLTPRSTRAPSPKYSWHLFLSGSFSIHSDKSHPNKSLAMLEAKRTAETLGLEITEWKT